MIYCLFILKFVINFIEVQNSVRDPLPLQSTDRIFKIIHRVKNVNIQITGSSEPTAVFKNQKKLFFNF